MKIYNIKNNNKLKRKKRLTKKKYLNFKNHDTLKKKERKKLISKNIICGSDNNNSDLIAKSVSYKLRVRDIYGKRFRSDMDHSAQREAQQQHAGMIFTNNNIDFDKLEESAKKNIFNNNVNIKNLHNENIFKGNKSRIIQLRDNSVFEINSLVNWIIKSGNKLPHNPDIKIWDNYAELDIIKNHQRLLPDLKLSLESKFPKPLNNNELINILIENIEIFYLIGEVAIILLSDYKDEDFENSKIAISSLKEKIESLDARNQNIFFSHLTTSNDINLKTIIETIYDSCIHNCGYKLASLFCKYYLIIMQYDKQFIKIHPGFMYYKNKIYFSYWVEGKIELTINIYTSDYRILDRSFCNCARIFEIEIVNYKYVRSNINSSSLFGMTLDNAKILLDEFQKEIVFGSNKHHFNNYLKFYVDRLNLEEYRYSSLILPDDIHNKNVFKLKKISFENLNIGDLIIDQNNNYYIFIGYKDLLIIRIKYINNDGNIILSEINYSSIKYIISGYSGLTIKELINLYKSNINNIDNINNKDNIHNNLYNNNNLKTNNNLYGYNNLKDDDLIAYSKRIHFLHTFIFSGIYQIKNLKAKFEDLLMWYNQSFNNIKSSIIDILETIETSIFGRILNYQYIQEFIEKDIKHHEHRINNLEYICYGIISTYSLEYKLEKIEKKIFKENYNENIKKNMIGIRVGNIELKLFNKILNNDEIKNKILKTSGNFNVPNINYPRITKLDSKFIKWNPLNQEQIDNIQKFRFDNETAVKWLNAITNENLLNKYKRHLVLVNEINQVNLPIELDIVLQPELEIKQNVCETSMIKLTDYVYNYDKSFIVFLISINYPKNGNFIKIYNAIIIDNIHKECFRFDPLFNNESHNLCPGSSEYIDGIFIDIFNYKLPNYYYVKPETYQIKKLDITNIGYPNNLPIENISMIVSLYFIHLFLFNNRVRNDKSLINNSPILVYNFIVDVDTTTIENNLNGYINFISYYLKNNTVNSKLNFSKYIKQNQDEIPQKLELNLLNKTNNNKKIILILQSTYDPGPNKAFNNHGDEGLFQIFKNDFSMFELRHYRITTPSNIIDILEGIGNSQIAHFIIMAHGTNNYLKIGQINDDSYFLGSSEAVLPESNQYYLNTIDFAKILKPKLNKGCSILLHSCCTGMGGPENQYNLANQLAKNLEGHIVFGSEKEIDRGDLVLNVANINNNDSLNVNYETIPEKDYEIYKFLHNK